LLVKSRVWCLVSVVFALTLSAAAFADPPGAFDWPQWQGTDRMGVSKEPGLLKEWPAAGPAMAWEAKNLGGGYSEPSIAAGKVFGMGNRGSDEIVWALSEKDGKQIWAMPIGPAYKQGSPQGNEGPACTPTVDGDFLYVEGLGGTVACLQVADGKIVWKKSFTADFGGQMPQWSFRESPLVDGDRVFVTPGGRDATFVALNKKTGETLWKCLVPGAPRASYVSAIVADAGGQRQYIQFTQKALVGVAAADGKLLWSYDKPANRQGIICSTPVLHDSEVFASSAYTTGGGLIKLSKDDKGGVKFDEVYFTKNMQSQHGGMVLIDGALYGASGGNEGGFLTCIDFATGKVLWTDRKVPKGSIAAADGRLYFRTESGVTYLIEPSQKGLVEHGQFKQPDRSKANAWPHPVIANGKLYLRDQDVMLVYDVKAK
jgi:outer membrane protein assembly factor BamB